MLKEKEFQLGDVIRTLRLRMKLKQEELAVKSGIPRSVISAHETNRRHPTEYQIQRYNEIFGCDITKYVNVTSKERMTSKSVRLPEELYHQLKNEAERNQMDTSSYMRILLEKGIHEDMITKSMDTLIVMIQEAMSRTIRKDSATSKEIPIVLYQLMYMIKFMMRDSLHLSAIEIDSMLDDAKNLGREAFYRQKGKGDSK